MSMQLAPMAEARLTAGDPVKNARAILRYALPIENTSARRVQVTLSGPLLQVVTINTHDHAVHQMACQLSLSNDLCMGL